MNIIDVSSNNHPNGAPIDWRAVRTAGIEAAYVKATEAHSYVNPWFARDVQGAKDAGLLVGAYHFARPTAGPADVQALAFANQAQRYRFDLPYALDLEDGAQIGWAPLAAWARSWFAHPLIAATRQVVYVNRDYLERLPGCPWGQLLWLADPSPQPHYPCWLWQHGQGHIGGVIGPVDLDTLRGDPAPPGPNTPEGAHPILPTVDRPATTAAVPATQLEVIPPMQFVVEFVQNPNPLDGNGHGWVQTAIPWDHVLGVSPQGPSPAPPPDGNNDGYWPPIQLEEADHNGNLLVTVYGAPGQATGFWVRHLVD